MVILYCTICLNTIKHHTDLCLSLSLCVLSPCHVSPHQEILACPLQWPHRTPRPKRDTHTHTHTHTQINKFLVIKTSTCCTFGLWITTNLICWLQVNQVTTYLLVIFQTILIFTVFQMLFLFQFSLHSHSELTLFFSVSKVSSPVDLMSNISSLLPCKHQIFVELYLSHCCSSSQFWILFG